MISMDGENWEINVHIWIVVVDTRFLLPVEIQLGVSQVLKRDCPKIECEAVNSGG